jgi:hypothetical protein
MATDKRKKIILNTPVGTARFPWLTKADTKFNAGGEYKTDLLFNSIDEVAPLVAALDKVLEEAVATQRDAMKPGDAKKLKVVHFLHHEEDSEGEETGRVFMRFKLKATVTMKDGKTFEQKPNGFDAAGEPIPMTVPVYAGSQIKINFEACPYYSAVDKAIGLSLRLRAYKVISLSSGSGSSASSYGFGDVEDGYSAKESGSTDADTSAPFQEDDF